MPHEPELRAWLKGRFPASVEIDDIVQESYIRLLRTQQHAPVRYARAYLFSTARNLALAQLRRPQIFSHDPLSDREDLAHATADGDIAEDVSTRQEIALLFEAIETLPRRCREILVLRRLQGVPPREIAAQLSISDETVQTQLARGLQRCLEYLRQRGVTGRHEAATERG
jgi:RNA polymerase sigma-70 factor (ECF subfamily)